MTTPDPVGDDVRAQPGDLCAKVYVAGLIEGARRQREADVTALKGAVLWRNGEPAFVAAQLARRPLILPTRGDLP